LKGKRRGEKAKTGGKFKRGRKRRKEGYSSAWEQTGRGGGLKEIPKSQKQRPEEAR